MKDIVIKMKYKKFYCKYFILALLLFINVFIDVVALGADELLEKQKIIKVAKKEIKIMGYDVELMDLTMTFYEEPWNAFLPKDNMSSYVIERKNKLKNKKYWAVYFSRSSTDNKFNYKGGDVCVFIDAKTGDMLASFRGK